MDAGAHYVTTQLFFENRHYFDFVERCRAAGITVPIVPGLKVLTSRRQLTSLPARFHVSIPEELAGEVMEAPDEHVTDVGIEWARRQAAELLEAGVPYLHFYIMGTANHVQDVVRHIRA